jgi:hypothetical protein
MRKRDGKRANGGGVCIWLRSLYSQVEFGLVRVQFVPAIRSIVPPFATHSAHWDRFLFNCDAVARTLGA